MFQLGSRRAFFSGTLNSSRTCLCVLGDCVSLRRSSLPCFFVCTWRGAAACPISVHHPPQEVGWFRRAAAHAWCFYCSRRFSVEGRPILGGAHSSEGGLRSSRLRSTPASLSASALDPAHDVGKGRFRSGGASTTQERDWNGTCHQHPPRVRSRVSLLLKRLDPNLPSAGARLDLGTSTYRSRYNDVPFNGRGARDEFGSWNAK